MSLQRTTPDGSLRVRWVRADAIAINQDEYSRSLLLSPERVQADWPPATVEAIDADALDALLAWQPQVLIVGTGLRQRFLPPALLARALGRGVGLECMDNAAAARTYNLLADEGRKVAAAFLLPAT